MRAEGATVINISLPASVPPRGTHPPGFSDSERVMACGRSALQDTGMQQNLGFGREINLLRLWSGLRDHRFLGETIQRTE